MFYSEQCSVVFAVMSPRELTYGRFKEIVCTIHRTWSAEGRVDEKHKHKNKSAALAMGAKRCCWDCGQLTHLSGSSECRSPGVGKHIPDQVKRRLEEDGKSWEHRPRKEARGGRGGRGGGGYGRGSGKGSGRGGKNGGSNYDPSKVTCWHFAAGSCLNGENCKFLHSSGVKTITMAMMAKAIGD